MNWFQKFVVRLLRITPATDRKIVIKEPLSLEANIIKNQIWYRGDSVELEQFFKGIAQYDIEKARFWASVPEIKIRKSHSGIVKIVINRLTDIILSDLQNIEFENEKQSEIWAKIEEDNMFNDLLDEAIKGALSAGDGAFKISISPTELYPCLEFYTADNVDYVYQYRKLKEIHFYTSYYKENKEYRLKEIYGKGYVNYVLYNEEGKEVPLIFLEETAKLKNITFSADFIMGKPLKFYSSDKWKNRGEALFDSKSDCLDGLDEIISQWLDAVRAGRINKYIPEDLLPRNPNTGILLEPNDFDNRFIAIGSSLGEDSKNEINIQQPNVDFNRFVESYSNFLDLSLQGIVSPSTLGIDLKKMDNAEAQREKEKITVHTVNKITSTLTKTLSELIAVVMQVNDLVQNRMPEEYEVTVKFGEYATPTFENIIDTVGKAKSYGVMSVETCIEEMYGDTWTDEEKAEEVARIKEAEGIGIIDDVEEDDENTDTENIKDTEENNMEDESQDMENIE